MRAVLETVIRYRLHVMLMLFVLVLAAFAGDLDGEKIRVALAFAFWGGFVYLFNKASDGPEDAVNKAGFPVSAKQFETLRLIAGGLFAIGAALLTPYDDLLLLYAGLSVLGLLYNGTAFAPGLRLKKILFVKNVVSAAAWACVPAFTPPLFYGNPIGPYNIISFFFTFFLMMAVELVWDIRDIRGDRKAGMNTVPVKFGVRDTKIFAIVPLGGYVVGLLAFGVPVPWYQLLAVAATIVVTAKVKENSSPYLFQAIIPVWILALVYHTCNASW